MNSKRALIPVIGKALNWLFGLTDEIESDVM